jgi:hypothetical protein
MPDKRFLQNSGPALYIETSSDAGDAALAPKFIQVMQELCKMLGKGFSELKDNKPEQMNIQLGIGVANDGNFIIKQTSENANFLIKLTWGGSSSLDSAVPFAQ